MGERMNIVPKATKAIEVEEGLLGPRLAAWLPEATWEWKDRVVSNPWPCELALSAKAATAKPPLTSDDRPG
jgi:hypothetical protein